ncbi:hypothetical protein HDV06_004156 [Boothiomyces sp. JEL0866]|nr:hypothetical protein HDV06_004156 [Boothiomyces sp. JEL0866]
MEHQTLAVTEEKVVNSDNSMSIQPSVLSDSLRPFPDSEDWVNPYTTTYHTLSGTSCPTPSNFDYFNPLLKRRSTDSHLEQEDIGFNEWNISNHKRTRTASSEATLATSLPNFNSNHSFTRNYIRTRQNSISSSMGYMQISNYNAPAAPISVDIQSLLNYSGNGRVANPDQVVDVHREINSFIYEANNIAAQDSIRNTSRPQLDCAPISNSIPNSQDSTGPLSSRTDSDDVTMFPMDYIKEESPIDSSIFDVSVTQGNSDSDTQPNSAAVQGMTLTQTIQDLASPHDFSMTQDFLGNQEYSTSTFKLVHQDAEMQQGKPDYFQDFSINGENSTMNYSFPISIEAINASFLKRVEEIPGQPSKSEMVVVKKPSPKKQPTQEDPTVRAQELKFESDLYTPKMKRFAHSFISYDEAVKCLTTPHKLQTTEPVILESNPLKLLVGRTITGDLFIPLGMTVSNSMLQDMKSHESGKMSGVW